MSGVSGVTELKVEQEEQKEGEKEEGEWEEEEGLFACLPLVNNYPIS